MSRKTLLRKNSRAHKIMKALTISSGVLIVSTLSPAGGTRIIKSFLAEYFRRKKFERYRFLNDLKNLQERKLLDCTELLDGKIEMKITRRGKEVMLKYQLDEIQLQKQLVWDKKWRLVMFDIPHEKRRARDGLREKLKDLKFHQLQKSVFITPCPCENEIDFIAEVFNVRKYILMLTVSTFEGEEKLKHYFHL